ncbi:MAG: DUF1810 domain-containing protein [Lachnospiraceae bacterium]|nr:DUF1810 domain-containing protein [Lachnospiraceae bacterium]
MNHYYIQRFVDAQNSPYAGYETALKEMKNGRKVSHWIWYIFPQLKQLGRSSTAKHYGISGLKEAMEYMKHPLLKERLLEISNVILKLPGDDPHRLMGFPDDLKLQSCMTLFTYASDEDVFQKVLDKYYAGKKDSKTVEIIQEDIIKEFCEVEADYENLCGRCYG